MQAQLKDKAPLFIVGKVYKRSTIHDQYGGNRQGGIAASALYPFIFIFSGEGKDSLMI